jgi:hypothetical protein
MTRSRTGTGILGPAITFFYKPVCISQQTTNTIDVRPGSPVPGPETAEPDPQGERENYWSADYQYGTGTERVLRYRPEWPTVLDI